MADARHRAITSYPHTTSRAIINRLVHEGIGTLVIGKNVGWKQTVNMGKKNNQAFVFLPHARFVELLSYKAELVGIQVVLTEESYTSKASFLDGDPLPVYGAADGPTSTNTPAPVFSGKRVKRGLYRAANGRHINADINGSYNILRKAFPNAFAQVAEQNLAQVKIHPIRLRLPDRRQDRRKQSRTLCATG
jgi:putative transposase